MKLYATTTSERASKGQGGNDYLEIDINAEKVSLGKFIVKYEEDIVPAMNYTQHTDGYTIRDTHGKLISYVLMDYIKSQKAE